MVPLSGFPSLLPSSLSLYQEGMELGLSIEDAEALRGNGKGGKKRLEVV